jgi:hypothetical protein
VNDLPLTKISETATTITLGWTPTGDRGYRFTREKANGAWSSTWDPTVKQATFTKDSAWYKVEALGAVAGGQYPAAGTPKVTSSLADEQIVTAPVIWEAKVSGFVAPPTDVNFYVDNALKWTEHTPPYYFNGDPGGRFDPATYPGPHVLKIKAVAPGETAEVTVDVTGKPPVPPPAGKIPRYGGATGFHIMNLSTSLAEVNRELDLWDDVGAQYLRWDWLDNSAYISRFDTILAGCEARGIKALPCARGTSGPYGNPTSARELGKRLTDKYSPHASVVGLEYVNEPNLAYPPSSYYPPETYGRELAEFYAGVKSVNPNLLVLNGGMGLDRVGAAKDWWPKVMANGGRDHFDRGCGHCYNWNSSQWTEIFSLDFQGKPVIVTESGSNPPQQASGIPGQMKDARAASVCIYSMLEMVQWKLEGNPGYAAYKGVPKA